MLVALRQVSVVLFAFVILCGAVYPAVVTGVSRLAFPSKAEGSLIKNKNGTIVGSALIGQQFTGPQYFWGRLSSTAPTPYNAAASGGSNLSNAAPALLDAAKARIAALKASDPENTEDVPVDLVTASASGLDPHISLAAATYQAGRVAKARGLSIEKVRELIDRHTKKRTLGILGEPVVNVPELNLALDEQ
ncbi:MAG: potassium-transporting ATPase subunit KdpC [Rickettsiales bacterium]